MCQGSLTETSVSGTEDPGEFQLDAVQRKTRTDSLRDVTVAAVNWLSPLVGEWMDRLRHYHRVGDTAALPGAKVVALICAHIHRVFTVRRKVLRDNVEYCCRSRDPGASL